MATDIHIRVDDRDAELLRVIAEAEQRSIASLARMLLRESLAKYSREKVRDKK